MCRVWLAVAPVLGAPASARVGCRAVQAQRCDRVQALSVLSLRVVCEVTDGRRDVTTDDLLGDESGVSLE